MDSGYVKFYRKTFDNPTVCKDADHLAVWVYLLTHATYKLFDVTFEGKRITLEPGQMITGRKAISAALSVNEYKVQRVLKCFEIAQQIAQQTTRHNRLITVLNWSMYQDSAQQDTLQMHNDCTTTAHKQEIKELKKNKNVYKPQLEQFDAFWSAYPRKIEKPAARRAWNARLKEGCRPEDLVSASKMYAAACSDKEQKYIKHASTFLGRDTPFLDYLVEEAKPSLLELPPEATAPMPQLLAYMQEGDDK